MSDQKKKKTSKMQTDPRYALVIIWKQAFGFLIDVRLVCLLATKPRQSKLLFGCICSHIYCRFMSGRRFQLPIPYRNTKGTELAAP